MPYLVGRIIKWRSPRKGGYGEYCGTSFICRVTYDRRVLVSGCINGDYLSVKSEWQMIVHTHGRQPIEYEVTNAGQYCLFNTVSYDKSVVAHDLFISLGDALDALERIKRVCVANGITVKHISEHCIAIITGNGYISKFYIEEII